MTSARVGYLGLGSNVGERRANLEAAIAALPVHGVEVLAASSVYETEPVGEIAEQRDFLNACARVSTLLAPRELLAACKEVERACGRTPGGIRHGPREIDIDLLMLGDLELEEPELRLPHPEVRSRRFVLVPLLELDPAIELPDGSRLADALAQLGDDEQPVRLAGAPLA